MGKLSEEIGKFCNLLEESIEEKDWNLVQKVLDYMDEMYEELEDVGTLRYE